ncbi:MAG: hypothetical protein ACK5RE_19200, partial [Pseudanabaena sp.]
FLKTPNFCLPIFLCEKKHNILLGGLGAPFLLLGFDFVITQSTVAITKRIKATQIAAFILLG